MGYSHNKVSTLLEKVRETKPLIHNITNIVVANFTANGLLAVGAKPVMASAPEEVAEMAQSADALILNFGTLSRERLDAMLLASQAANAKGIPIVFDPVGVGATIFRTESARRLLHDSTTQYIRGNAAEIANLIGEKWEIKGVESGHGNMSNVVLAKMAAQILHTTIIVTGKEDVITDGATTFVVQNGHPLLTKVTGAGCLLSAIIGAFAALETDSLLASVSALSFYGIAAEIAASITSEQGPGSFQVELINQLSLVGANEIMQYCSIKRL